MPANLNALIRYKTINNCLAGGRRKWSIGELKGACSEALAEARGRYEPVSERTLRDDIRVMRSDILGFNAPIVQEKGLYFYSDPHYSIMSVSITDSGLARQILKMLLDIRTKISHPELEIILEKLSGMTGGIYEKQAENIKEAIKPAAQYEAGRKASASGSVKKLHDISLTSDEEAPAIYQEHAVSFMVIPKELTWQSIFRIL